MPSQPASPASETSYCIYEQVSACWYLLCCTPGCHKTSSASPLHTHPPTALPTYRCPFISLLLRAAGRTLLLRALMHRPGTEVPSPWPQGPPAPSPCAQRGGAKQTARCSLKSSSYLMRPSPFAETTRSSQVQEGFFHLPHTINYHVCQDKQPALIIILLNIEQQTCLS